MDAISVIQRPLAAVTPGRRLFVEEELFLWPHTETLIAN